jgi:hypothetical protein
VWDGYRDMCALSTLIHLSNTCVVIIIIFTFGVLMYFIGFKLYDDSWFCLLFSLSFMIIFLWSLFITVL